jgi:hypothetical protein
VGSGFRCRSSGIDRLDVRLLDNLGLPRGRREGFLDHRLGFVLLRLAAGPGGEGRRFRTAPPVEPAGGRLPLRGQLDPVDHPLHELDEKLAGRIVGDHRDAEVGLEPVLDLCPILDGP